MSIKLGVSLYSYQQSQFFKELSLEDQIREVGENLPDAVGIEIIDEMSLRYPDPGQAFIDTWFGWMEKYGTVPVAMDVGMDVLQFRDHVMTIEECAERLRHDIRLAKSLGFSVVRVLSTTPLSVMAGALDVAESLDIRLGKEIHQPMALEGPQVTEIVEFAEKSGSVHIGIVPDLGIFQFRPSEALLGWFERKGAQKSATDASLELAERIRLRDVPSEILKLSLHSAGNIRADFRRWLSTGDSPTEAQVAFETVRELTELRVTAPREIDYLVVAEALLFSNTSAETLRQLCPRVVSVHGKFYEMSEIPGKPGQYQDISIDYEAAIGGLRDGGFEGYVNSEYEGQRYYQDRGREDVMSEVDQVRRHQEMLSRLIT